MHDYHPPAALLANKRILVTGPTAGIGRQLVFSILEQGGIPILLGRDAKKLRDLQQEIELTYQVQSPYFILDLADAVTEDYQCLREQLDDQIFGLDALVHNASVLGQLQPLANISDSEWDWVMQVNLKGQFQLTQQLLPLLGKAPTASIIFTSSGVGQQGRATWGTYAISKFATEGLMQVWAEELNEQGIRVNCINPGATRTQMRAAAKPEEDPLVLRTPAQIMPLYLYLLGDDSIGVTGQTLKAQPDR